MVVSVVVVVVETCYYSCSCFGKEREREHSYCVPSLAALKYFDSEYSKMLMAMRLLMAEDSWEKEVEGVVVIRFFMMNGFFRPFIYGIYLVLLPWG